MNSHWWKTVQFLNESQEKSYEDGEIKLEHGSDYGGDEEGVGMDDYEEHPQDNP